MPLSLLFAAALAIKPLELKPCRIEGLDRPALCGVHKVFENRQAFRGRMLPIKVVVVPARHPHPDQGPVVYLTGGPGETDTEEVADLVGGDADDHDMVFVDERGTGEGHRLDCPSAGSDDNLQGYLRGPFDPAALKACAARLSRSFDLSQYTTPNFADDLDEVRQALGYNRINLEAGSFGTYAALTYIHRHGEHVRSAYLTSLVVVANKVPLNHARAEDEGLAEVLGECEIDPACHGAYPTIRADVAALATRLRAEPVLTWVRHPVTGARTPIRLDEAGFADGLRTMLYSTEQSRKVPWLIEQAKAGDFSPFAERAVAASRNIYSGLRMGLSLAITCNEFTNRIRPQEVGPATDGTLLGDRRVRSQMAVCADWPRTQAPAAQFQPFRAEVPTVLVSGAADPASRPSWGEAAARILPNSVHVVVPGGGHVPENACVADLRRQLFASGSVATLDQGCVAAMKPAPFKPPSP